MVLRLGPSVRATAEPGRRDTVILDSGGSGYQSTPALRGRHGWRGRRVDDGRPQHVLWHAGPHVAMGVSHQGIFAHVPRRVVAVATPTRVRGLRLAGPPRPR